MFGIGLSKTGTTSLGAALVQLGYRNLHNDRSLVAFLYPDRAVNMSGRYDDLDAVEDLPVALYYKELLVAYPQYTHEDTLSPE